MEWALTYQSITLFNPPHATSSYFFSSKLSTCHVEGVDGEPADHECEQAVSNGQLLQTSHHPSLQNVNVALSFTYILDIEALIKCLKDHKTKIYSLGVFSEGGR